MACGPGGDPGREGRALSGQREFEAFFERHHVELARWAYVMTGHVQVAEDVTMETFEAVWRQWDAVSAADSPLAYTRRILMRKASAHWEHRRRERDRRLAVAREVEEHRPWEETVLDRLDALPLLAALPERKRTAVILRVGFGLSVRETAEVMGVSEGTVKSQTAKALDQLREGVRTPDPDGAR